MTHEVLNTSTALPEISPQPEATEDQLSIARVNGFFSQLRYMRSMAEEYTAWQVAKSIRSGHPQDKNTIRDNTRDVFFRIYFAHDRENTVEKVREDYGFDSGPLIRLFRERKPVLDELVAEEERNAAEITKSHRIITLVKETAFAYFNRSTEQKTKLMEIAGISGEEIGRYAQSLKLTTNLLLPLEGAVFAANAVGIKPVFGSIEDSQTQIALTLAYATIAVATYLNFLKNRQAMHTPELGLSPNILVTYVYTLVKKQVPDSDFWPDFFVFALSTLPVAIPEALMSLGVLEGGHGTTAAVFRVIIGSLNQLFQRWYLNNLITKAVASKKV